MTDHWEGGAKAWGTWPGPICSTVSLEETHSCHTIAWAASLLGRAGAIEGHRLARTLPTRVHFDGSPQVSPLLPQLCQPVPQGLLLLQQLVLSGLQPPGVRLHPVFAVFVLLSIYGGAQAVSPWCHPPCQASPGWTQDTVTVPKPRGSRK